MKSQELLVTIKETKQDDGMVDVDVNFNGDCELDVLKMLGMLEHAKHALITSMGTITKNK